MTIPSLRPMILRTAAATALVSVAMAATSQAQVKDEVNDDRRLNTVVVTSQKRASTVLETAAAITAIDGETLEKLGADDLSELGKFTPSFSYSENFGISQIFIRGVGNNFFSPGGDPGVALYSDGVYLSDQEATGIALLDVERIEILRGPQGALYGRNATGGAVNLVSRAPEEEFGAALGITAGDFGRLELSADATGEIAQGVRGRIVGRYKELDGFANNLSSSGPDALDGEESFAVRAQVAIDAFGGELTFIGSAFSQDDVGPGLKILPDPFPQPAELLFGVRPSSDERDYFSEVSENERKVHAFTAKWTGAIPFGELTIIADHRTSDRIITYDQDGTPANQSVTSLDTDSSQSYFEAYLASEETEKYSWLLGANYNDFDQSRTTFVDGFLPGALLDPSLPITLPAPFAFAGGGDLESESFSIFAEGSVAISPKVRLRAGVRQNFDEKSVDEFLNFFTMTEGSQSESWDEVSGMIGAEYAPTQDTLLYAKASRGYKAGALNLGAFTPAVDPEIILNYELGAKVGNIGGVADVSVSAFTSDYSDLQVVQIGPLSQILSNAAEASISGVEIEGQLRPTNDLPLAANLSWLDAEFDAFTTTDARRGFASFDLSGNQLPLTSKWQIGVLASQRFDFENGAVATITGQAGWRSEFFFTEFNTVDAVQDDVATFDISADWTSPAQAWKLSIFGRNLSNETVTGSLAIVSPLLGSVRVASINPPRHFGVSVNRSFR